ncbi:MAG: tetratricopeptide repeat protein [Candidatus Binatia bacterium]
MLATSIVFAISDSQKGEPTRQAVQRWENVWSAKISWGRQQQAAARRGYMDRYDVFVSYCYRDQSAVRALVEALRLTGLQVGYDERNSESVVGIPGTVHPGIAHTKAVLVYYSSQYAMSRACQWEFTAAFLAAQQMGEVAQRVLVITPTPTLTTVYPADLRLTRVRSTPIPPDPPALRALAHSIHARVDALTGRLGNGTPLHPPVWYGWKGLGSARFTGRLAELWQLHAALHRGATRQRAFLPDRPVVSVWGLSGVGKSLLAEEYALRYGAAYPGGIFWVRALGRERTHTGLPSEVWEAERHHQYRTFAEELGIPVAGQRPAELTRLLSHTLSTQAKPYLWIVDDLPADLPDEAVRAWCAPNALGHTLITTPGPPAAGGAEHVLLAGLAPHEAYHLLTARAVPQSEDEQHAATALTHTLGAQALAVELAGSVVRRSSFTRLLQDLCHPNRQSQVVADELRGHLPPEHATSIVAMLLTSLAQLGPAGQECLQVVTALATSLIPVDLLTATLAAADAVDPETARTRALRGIYQATALSLAETRGEDDFALRVHPLVAWIAHRTMGATHRWHQLHAAVLQTLTTRVLAGAGRRSQTGLRWWLPPARLLSAAAHDRATADVGGVVALHDFAWGHYASADILWTQQVTVLQQELGVPHPRTLTALNNLAQTRKARGDLAGARILQEQVLQQRQQLLGPEHPDTLTAMNNLAGTYYAQGDLGAAQTLQEHVLQVTQHVLGPEHPDTLTAMDTLAQTRQAQGDLGAAQTLQKRVLQVRQRLLGPEHPDTLTAMNNLAGTYYAHGDRATAQTLQEQVLQVRLRLLGSEHPDTLTAMNNLAGTRYAHGDLTAARILQEEVLRVSQRVLGPEHPDTLTAMNNLAQTQKAHGDLTAARTLQEQVLQVSQRVLGVEHPKTLTAMNNLAQTQKAHGDLTAARTLQEQVLQVSQRVLGVEHPDTLTALNNLAGTRYAQGDLAVAQGLQEQMLEISRRVLGPEHPETLTAMNNLAQTRKAQGDLAVAQGLQEQMLEISRRVLGPEHPETLTAMNNLAQTRKAQGDVATARALQEQVFQISRRVLGPEHPDTTVAAWNFFRTLVESKEGERATQVLEQALLWLLTAEREVLAAQQQQIRRFLEKTKE